MAKLEWGTKRSCQNCGVKFYDFNRNPIICPSCGTPYVAEAALKPRRSRVEAKPKLEKSRPKLEEDETLGEQADGGLLIEGEDEDDESLVDEDADVEEETAGLAEPEDAEELEDDEEASDDDLDIDLEEDIDDVEESLPDLETDDEDR